MAESQRNLWAHGPSVPAHGVPPTPPAPPAPPEPPEPPEPRAHAQPKLEIDGCPTASIKLPDGIKAAVDETALKEALEAVMLEAVEDKQMADEGDVKDAVKMAVGTALKQAGFDASMTVKVRKRDDPVSGKLADELPSALDAPPTLNEGKLQRDIKLETASSTLGVLRSLARPPSPPPSPFTLTLTSTPTPTLALTITITQARSACSRRRATGR